MSESCEFGFENPIQTILSDTYLSLFAKRMKSAGFQTQKLCKRLGVLHFSVKRKIFQKMLQKWAILKRDDTGRKKKKKKPSS